MGSLEKKLTCQLVYPEDVKADTICRDYDKLRGLLLEDCPPLELDIFHYSQKNRYEMFKLGERIAKICTKEDNYINFVLTHPVTMGTYPKMSMTGGENRESFERCIKINELGLDFGEALKNNGCNVYLTIHVMGHSKDHQFEGEFIKRIRESCERRKTKIKPVFEARPASLRSYGKFPDDLIKYHKDKQDAVIDMGHSTTYEPAEKIIPVLEENPIARVMHITSYYDTHQIPTLEELKPWKNIILQSQIEYLLVECFHSKNEPLEKAKDRERKIWDNARRASEFSPFKRKWAYKIVKRNHNREALDAFEKAKPLIEELFS